MTFQKLTSNNGNNVVRPLSCNCGVNYNPQLSQKNFTIDQKVCASATT